MPVKKDPKKKRDPKKRTEYDYDVEYDYDEEYDYEESGDYQEEEKEVVKSDISQSDRVLLKLLERIMQL